MTQKFPTKSIDQDWSIIVIFYLLSDKFELLNISKLIVRV